MGPYTEESCAGDRRDEGQADGSATGLEAAAGSDTFGSSRGERWLAWLSEGLGEGAPGWFGIVSSISTLGIESP